MRYLRMIPFFDRVIKWLRGPTEEEMYESGKDVVDSMVHYTVDQSVIEYLFALSSGGFNQTPGQDAYDRGIQDRLRELGFESPY